MLTPAIIENYAARPEMTRPGTKMTRSGPEMTFGLLFFDKLCSYR